LYICIFVYLYISLNYIYLHSLRIFAAVFSTSHESYVRTQSDICCDYRDYGTFTIIDPAVACPREGKADICDMKSRDTVARIRKMYRGLQEGRTACHNAVTEQRGNYCHTLHLWGTSHYFSRFVSVLFVRYFIWKGRGCRMYLF